MVDERDGAWKSFDGMLLPDCPWKPPAARIRTVNNEVRSVADRSEHTSGRHALSSFETFMQRIGQLQNTVTVVCYIG